MLPVTEANRHLSKEFRFSTSRSSGAGGQHVNKVETKVEIRFNIEQSNELLPSEKAILQKKLKTYINADGDLVLVEQSSRSQFRNKSLVIKRLYALLNWGLRPEKPRLATRPSRSSIRRRLEGKRQQSEKKALRREKFD
jgi:ribosome-associated protein